MGSAGSQPASLSAVEQTESPSGSAPSLGVTVIVIGTIVRIIPLVAAFLRPTGSVATWLADYSPVPDFPAGTPLDVVAKAAMLGILVLSVLSIVGLLQRRTWGWTLAIVTAGIVLALNIGWWASGESRYLSMAVNTIVVFYLSQRDLRAAYGVTG
jgi:hypothetical protein